MDTEKPDSGAQRPSPQGALPRLDLTGPENSDWIKRVGGGAAQRRDLAAGHENMARYYESRGDTERAQLERAALAVLQTEVEDDQQDTLAAHHRIMAHYYAVLGDAAGEQRERAALAALAK